MGLFDLFARRPALSEGLEQYRNTSGAVLLDVRTPEEYRDGHLPGAKNLPLDRL
ncbi:MAG: rhodanese-like domain-containing protein, partial [Flavonifractor plautii]